MISKFIYCFILVLSFSGIAISQIDQSAVTKRMKCKKDTTQQYALYVPKDYSPEKMASLLIFLDPAARGDLPLIRYRSLADENNIIMAGSYNSRNFDGQSSVDAFVAVYNDIVNLYVINPERIWISGFSGGSRAAATLSMNFSEIKGVIACGAGFANDEEIKKANLKAYAAIVGDRDMNYSELVDNSNFLDEKEVNNILLTFKGTHMWPPIQLIGLAIEWLLNENTGTSKTQESRKLFFIQSLQNKLDSGFLYEAWMDAKQLSRIPAYKNKADSLLYEITNRKLFITDKERFKQAILGEQNCMNDFSIAFSRMIENNEDIEDSLWTQKAKAVADLMNDKNRYRQMAAERCFDHCIRTCQEYHYRFFADADYKRAYNTARILSLFIPQNPEPYYLMARSDASAGNRKRCKKMLEEAVKKGLRFSRSIAQDAPLLKALNTEEIEKMFDQK